MVDTGTIQIISKIIASAGVFFAVIYYTLTLRKQQETRNAQFFLQIYQNAQDQGFLQTISETIWLQNTENFMNGGRNMDRRTTWSSSEDGVSRRG